MIALVKPSNSVSLVYSRSRALSLTVTSKQSMTRDDTHIHLRYESDDIGCNCHTKKAKEDTTRHSGGDEGRIVFVISL